MQGGRRAGAGRKPVEIDLVELEKLCSFQCTHEERRGALVRYGPLRHFRRRCGLLSLMVRKRRKGRISIRMTQR
jgi:hypothetical protein